MICRLDPNIQRVQDDSSHVRRQEFCSDQCPYGGAPSRCGQTSKRDQGPRPGLRRSCANLCGSARSRNIYLWPGRPAGGSSVLSLSPEERASHSTRPCVRCSRLPLATCCGRRISRQRPWKRANRQVMGLDRQGPRLANRGRCVRVRPHRVGRLRRAWSRYWRRGYARSCLTGTAGTRWQGW